MKLKILKIIIFLFGLISISRLYYLQIYKHDYYTKLLGLRNDRTFTSYSAPRGRILDCNGKVLVDNKGTRVIVYQKNNSIKDIDEIDIATKLASIVLVDDGNEDDIRKYSLVKYKVVKNLSPIEIKASYIYRLMNKDYDYQKKVLFNDISDQDYIKVIESNLKGIYGEIRWERIYNYDYKLLGNIGSIPYEEKDYYLNNNYKINDIVGISYLEKEYDLHLRGSDAVYKINNDNTISLIKEEKRGKDLILNIDIELQNAIIEILDNNILKAKTKLNTYYYDHSYVIVSDIYGNIKSLVGRQIGKDNKEFYDISNKAIYASYTVGSVVKGASMSVGYQNNLIDLNKKIKDSCIKLYNNPIKCSWKDLGYIDDILALKYSSNYYQFNIAIKLMNQKYYYNTKLKVSNKEFNIYRNTFNEFGLGVKTGIDLSNESIGIRGKKMAPDLLLNFAIGQYDTYTPIQLTSYINTIANNGNRYKLNLATSNNVLLNKVNLDSTYMDRIKEGFREVFTLHGTASGFIKNIDVAGKTGTSQSFIDTNNDNIVDKETITSSLVLYFPYDNPKYTLTIISPHISYENNNDSYKYNLNKYLSNEIINKMFALYKSF